MKRNYLTVFTTVFTIFYYFNVLSGQEYKHLGFVPSDSKAGVNKFTALAVNKEGTVYYIDDQSKSVMVFNESGVLAEKIKTIETTSGSITLSSPKAICVDIHNQLYIYDDDLGKIIRKPVKGDALVFGEKGSSRGQINNIVSIAADSKGYCYALNTSDRSIDVFMPNGTYQTWIDGGGGEFDDPISIGINGADELYVMDKTGPTVRMFDVFGTLVNTNRSLATRKNVRLSDPVSMGVLANGDFLILDESSCQITHFSRVGVMLGVFGSKNDKADKGIFVQATRVACSPGSPDKVCILDKNPMQAQLFNLTKIEKPLTQVPQRYKMVPVGSSRKPAFDLAAAPSGNRYVIPYKDHKKVVAYKDTSEVDVFTINGVFENAYCVASDSASNLYVVDRGADEVLMFDTKGSLVRKLGKDVKDKLRDPVSMLIQKSGNIIVADKSRASLYMWNSSGVFKNVITSIENSVIKSPTKIQCDTKDQIYVWDDELNCILRVGSGGWPTAEKKLFARPEKPGDKPGVIIDFFIDPADNIYLFNQTTQQIEVYSWQFEPVMKYSFGHRGEDASAFDNVDKMVLDKNTMHIYFSQNKGENQKAYQFLIPPPIPAGSINFDVIDGKLQVYFSKIDSKSVVAYGLLTSTVNGDSVAFRTTNSFFTVSQRPEDGELHHYDFVSLSLSDHSDPSFGFDDYFSYAESMIHAQRYEEALGAWQTALIKFGRPMRMAQHIAGRLAEEAVNLVSNYDLVNAESYVKEAYALDQKSQQVLNAYSLVAKSNYRQFANRGDINGIITNCENHQKDPILKMITMNALDSVSRVLALEENINSINSAILLQRKLIEWDKVNPGFQSSLSASFFELYKYKTVRETSQPELNSILDEVKSYGNQAYHGLKSAGRNYYPSHLIVLAALNETGKFQDVQNQAAFELGGTSAQMSKDILIGYRKELAKAFSGLKQPALAIAEYNTILKTAPDDRNCSELLANALIADKKYDDAKNVLQQLMLGNSDNSRLMAGIGYIELLKGNNNEAVFQLEKAIRQDPSLLPYYGYLAEAYDHSSMPAKALDYYEVAINFIRGMIARVGQRNPQNHELTDLPGKLERYLLASAHIHEGLGNVTESREILEEVTRLNPDNAKVWYEYGNACKSANRIYDAMEAYNNALERDQNNKTYINAYVNSVNLRENALKNEPALDILDIRVKNVFPSLYKNYADVRLLPVGEIIIANNTPDVISPSEVTVFAADLMTQPTVVSAPAINGYTNIALKISAIFPESILQNNDAQKHQITVEIKYKDQGKAHTINKTATFTLHGRNAIVWSDKRRLASFVSPNDVKMVEYNKKSDALFRNESTFGQNKHILKALQLYTLLNKSGLSYSNDPAQSYSTLSLHSDMIDYLQYPLETIKRKGGDCDDLVALYASMLENGGVSAAYIDLPGHVMAAFDAHIKPQQLADIGISDDEVIIIGDRVWIPIEATMLGTKNFFSAWKAGAERFYKDLNAGNFPEVIPFGDAWSIYQPSNYTPADVNPEPPAPKEVLDNYDVLLTQLVAKTKSKTISEVTARYNLEPENPYVLNLYGTLLAQTGETKKAREILEQAIVISPENATVLNNLGNVYLLEKNYQKAAYYYEQATNFDPLDPNILINLCKTYLARGEKDKARTSYEKAASLDPEIPEIFTDLKTQLK